MTLSGMMVDVYGVSGEEGNCVGKGIEGVLCLKYVETGEESVENWRTGEPRPRLAGGMCTDDGSELRGASLSG